MWREAPAPSETYGRERAPRPGATGEAAPSRAWVDRSWAALAGSGGGGGLAAYRGQQASGWGSGSSPGAPWLCARRRGPLRTILGSSRLRGVGDIRRAAAAVSVQRPPRNIVRRPHPLTLPAPLPGDGKRFLLRKESGVGAGVYLGGFLPAGWADRRQTRFYSLSAHKVP